MSRSDEMESSVSWDIWMEAAGEDRRREQEYG